MKIRLFSDLHNEFAPVDYVIPELPDDKETTLVLAGDIDVGGIKEGTANKLRDQFKYIVYIAGNHEFYGHDHGLLQQKLEEIVSYDDNLYYLDNDYVTLDGVVFYGGTAWTQTAPDRHDMLKGSMNDFISIKNVDLVTGKVDRFTPADANEENDEFVRTLEARLSRNDNELPVVVVSHHTPSDKSQDSRYDPSRLNCAYHNKFEGLIEDNPAIKLWCHGHVHNSNDYMLYDTRVVSNPYGYEHYETNGNFDATKVLEV